MNAIRLARAAGYAVLVMSSVRNFARLEKLGAEAVFDYHDKAAADHIATQLARRQLAVILAIGRGSLSQAVHITCRTSSSRRIASGYPTIAISHLSGHITSIRCCTRTGSSNGLLRCDRPI